MGWNEDSVVIHVQLSWSSSSFKVWHSATHKYKCQQFLSSIFTFWDKINFICSWVRQNSLRNLTEVSLEVWEGKISRFTPIRFSVPLLSDFYHLLLSNKSNHLKALQANFPFHCFSPSFLYLKIYHNKQFPLFIIKFQLLPQHQEPFWSGHIQKFPVLSHEFIEQLGSEEAELAIWHILLI